MHGMDGAVGDELEFKFVKRSFDGQNFCQKANKICISIYGISQQPKFHVRKYNNNTNIPGDIVDNIHAFVHNSCCGKPTKKQENSFQSVLSVHFHIL